MSTNVEPQKAVVLVSGGMDSAVTLAIARAQGLACHALSVDYGQRHGSELAAAARVANALGAVEHKIVAVDLRSIGGSALTADSIAVPEQGGALSEGVEAWAEAGGIDKVRRVRPERLPPAGLTLSQKRVPPQ